MHIHLIIIYFYSVALFYLLLYNSLVSVIPVLHTSRYVYRGYPSILHAHIGDAFAPARVP